MKALVTIIKIKPLKNFFLLVKMLLYKILLTDKRGREKKTQVKDRKRQLIL
jgi:hypothetical protein